MIDPATGRVLAEYGKFADAMGLDLRAWAQSELGLPLAIENDARMALIGEWRAGAGRGLDNLVMITLGTGLGTAAVMRASFCAANTARPACWAGTPPCAMAAALQLWQHRLRRSRGLHGVSLRLGGRPARSGITVRCGLTTLNYAAVFKHAAENDSR